MLYGKVKNEFTVFFVLVDIIKISKNILKVWLQNCNSRNFDIEGHSFLDILYVYLKTNNPIANLEHLNYYFAVILRDQVVDFDFGLLVFQPQKLMLQSEFQF